MKERLGDASMRIVIQGEPTQFDTTDDALCLLPGWNAGLDRLEQVLAIFVNRCTKLR